MKRITLLLITISSALISCEYNNLEKMYPAVEECDPDTSYADVQNVVVTGQLVSSVTHDGNAADMPKSLPKLEDCELNKIIAWVNQGSLE